MENILSFPAEIMLCMLGENRSIQTGEEGFSISVDA